jgi:hypothetical protein
VILAVAAWFLKIPCGYFVLDCFEINKKPESTSGNNFKKFTSLHSFTNDTMRWGSVILCFVKED